MNDEQQKSQLLKIYKILLGVMIGGAILIIGVQYAWNAVKENLAKLSAPKDTPSPSPTNTSLSSPEPTVTNQPVAASNNLTQQDAANLIDRWLEAKANIYARPFDRQLAASLTTGKVYEEITKPGGSIDWLQQNNSYYQYGYRQVSASYFNQSGDTAEIDVSIIEQFSRYQNGKVVESKTNSGDYRFILKQENGSWKIADRISKN